MTWSLRAVCRACCVCAASTIALGAPPPAGDPWAPPTPPAPIGAIEGLERLWTLPGAWSAVGADPATGVIYAMRFDWRTSRLDRTGRELASFVTAGPIADPPTTIRLANIAGDATPELVTFKPWGRAVRVFDAGGGLVWEHTGGDGIDDVCALDLDAGRGDGRDEVIIGYNGRTGLRAINADGSVRWTFAGIANVWHVTGGPTGEGGAAQVFTTAADGAIHVFDNAGAQVREMRPASYTTFVRVAPCGQDGALAIVTHDNAQSALTAIDPSGKQLWRTIAPGAGGAAGGRTMAYDAVAAPDRAWIAVAFGGGVEVYDVATGRRVASAAGGAKAYSVAWLPAAGGEPPVLLAATGAELAAFAVTGVHAPAQDAPGP